MSRLNDLVRQVGLTNETLAADLQREIAALADRRSFGLNFERHVPEAVELPGRPVRRGDKVRILPPRGETPRQADEKLWQVTRVDRAGESPVAELVALADETEAATASVEDLVVVAEFRDPIYPGLVSTGKVERGGDKPFHTVINAENYHALQALLFTHRGKVDCIYIDPPYNTGAKDWKYNNDYVESDDVYRHSKWLAFMERRLLLARELLNPEDSVLIVTIDEKEYLRLGLLLQQTFPGVKMQMVSAVVNPAGVTRPGAFARTDEYIYFVFFGSAMATPVPLGDEWRANPSDKRTTKMMWSMLVRTGTNARRTDRPNLFYPIFVMSDGSAIHSVGKAPSLEVDRSRVDAPEDTVAIWPIRSDGSEGNWQVSPESLWDSYEKGFVRLGRFTDRGMSISYLKLGEQRKVTDGTYVVTGRREDGSVIADSPAGAKKIIPTTAWRVGAHDASRHGSNLLKTLLPERKFPFPKSLYAVEDCLRFFVAEKPDAVVVDFFSGSGTTAHAVMRLNKQDRGTRRSISITNNEVSADEQSEMRSRGLRPGDFEWEARGICDFITKPRIEAAAIGKTPDGEPLKGDYKFTDEFPMAEGFDENFEFFTLTYEAPLRVASHRDFERIAPLLWLRAGSRGRRIDDLSRGWDVAEAYGVIGNLDEVEPFLKAVAEQEELDIAFIVTDEDRLFESVVRELPDHVEPVRLYEAYLRNFEIESGRGLR